MKECVKVSATIIIASSGVGSGHDTVRARTSRWSFFHPLPAWKMRPQITTTYSNKPRSAKDTRFVSRVNRVWVSLDVVRESIVILILVTTTSVALVLQYLRCQN